MTAPEVSASLRAVPLACLPLLPGLALASQVVLLGVVVSRAPERSAALLACDGRARATLVGESVCGARLVGVAPERVTLEEDGARRELGLSGSVVPPVAIAPRPATPASDAPGVRTLARAEVERRLSQEIPRILAETTLLPISEEGRVTGFALTRLPEGSLLTEAGLEAGDVLAEVNGTPIDSLATLAGLFTRLRQESEIQARVLRGGSWISLTLRLH